MNTLRFIRNVVIRKPAILLKATEGATIRPISSTAIQMKTFKQWYQQFWEESTPQPPWKHCTQIGDPILRQATLDVPTECIADDGVQRVIQQMIKTMRTYDLIGLAANQIGVQFSIVIIEVRKKCIENLPVKECAAKEMTVFPLTVVINPKIKVINYNQKVFSEGCGSVCGYTANVARYTEVQLTGHNEKAEPVALHLKGWTARIAQHEVDHLKGTMFTDLMDKKSLACAVWPAINFYGGKLEIPFYPKRKL